MAEFSFVPARYPARPGCYLMKNDRGQVIYVGKAGNLRRRLASYFQPGRRGRTARLAARIAAIEVILTANAAEGLILENNLIKHYRPRYNRRLKADDSGYYYIVLTGEAVPRLLPYRKNRVNKELERVPGQSIARRFGPYVSRRYRDQLLAFVVEQFQFRSCVVLPRRACLHYHLGRCSGICAGHVSVEDYAAAVERAAAFLSPDPAALLAEMRRRMAEHSERLEFERAARLRARLAALESALIEQVVERQVAHDQDAIYFGDTHALVVRVARGAVWGVALHELDLTAGHAAACERFLVARYRGGGPPELIVNRLPARCAAAAALGLCCDITVAGGGPSAALMAFCEQNYNYRLSLLGASDPPVAARL